MKKYYLSVSTGPVIHLSPLAICLAGGRIVFRGEPLTGLVLALAVGGLTLPLVLVQLFAGIGSQHYYPRVSTLGLWAFALLMLRVYVEQTRVQMGTIITEQPWNSPAFRKHYLDPDLPATSYGEAFGECKNPRERI